jgi:uncharacterized protein YigE (DUF2233 family)
MLFFLLLSFLFQDPSYVVHTTTPEKIAFHYDPFTERYLSDIKRQNPSAVFAMNASMYTPGYKAVGLYVEKGKVVSRIRIINNSKVNFGISQAVFYINTKGKAGIVKASEAKVADYYYAVQLAPMLVEKGKINPRILDMKNEYRRNAFGITKDGKVVMLVTTESVNMKQLAQFMIDNHCVDAAFVDGAVSQYWKPGNGDPYMGPFGVMVSANK